MVAVDPLGAGNGERVLVVFGRAARHVIGRGHDIGFQTAIAGIIDGMELDGDRTFGPSADLDPA
jgi:microcompartment protein CcmK/EutM